MPLPTTHSDPTTLWIVHKINKQLNTVVLMGPFRNARSTPFWFCHTFLPPKDNNLVMENLRMETADIHSKLKFLLHIKVIMGIYQILFLSFLCIYNLNKSTLRA